jgi:hypothetical protein
MVGSYLLQMNLRSGHGQLGLVTRVPALERAVTLRVMARMVARMPMGRATMPHAWLLLLLLHRHHHL